MEINPGLLGLRALQATRRLHLPTYVALRFLLASTAGRGESSWADAVLFRKYPTREFGRFQRTLKFKKINSDGEPEYREFYIPSPTTGMTEALVLAHLSKTNTFSKAANVYSYLWPRGQDCPYNFEHYVSGYKARNQNIAECLDQNKDLVLIVSDIEKFYPSIIRNRVKVRFNKALRDGGVGKEVVDSASALLEHLFAGVPGGRGIATGPELSHVIGDIALARVDQVLTERYSASYFRYVDDIVIAVPPEDVQKTLALLRGLVTDEELNIQIDKSEVVPAVDWLQHGPHNSHHVNENSFEALVFLIKVYLSRHNGAERGLNKILREHGFAIPLDRLAWAGRSSSFVFRLKRFRQRGWWVAMVAIMSSERDVVERALAVRKEVQESLYRALEASAPESATRRRWFIQHLRYLTNRAFYLFPTNDLGFLVDPLSRLPEFAETVALLKMLIDGDVGPILKMPGPGLMAGSGLLRQEGRRLPDIQQLQDIAPETVDVLSVLSLFDVASIDESIFEQLGDGNMEFLRFCAGQTPTRRVRSDFSYIDEIRCLQLARTSEDNLAMIESRFSDQEGVVLDALDIGGEYSY